jgi:hypothetical protein
MTHYRNTAVKLPPIGNLQRFSRDAWVLELPREREVPYAQSGGELRAMPARPSAAKTIRRYTAADAPQKREQLTLLEVYDPAERGELKASTRHRGLRVRVQCSCVHCDSYVHVYTLWEWCTNNTRAQCAHGTRIEKKRQRASGSRERRGPRLP